MREMKDSGIEWIGEIPADWKVVKVANQYTERKVKVSDNDYPPLSVTMKDILPQLATAAKTDAHDDRKLVCKGDFAINSRSDRRGSCGISPYDGSVSLINTILKPRDEMNAEYYDWLFHTTMFSDEFYKWGHGIVNDLWTTNWQDMKKISIPEPALPEQQKIADYLDQKCSEIDTLIAKKEQIVTELENYKKSLIYEYVTGKREVSDMNEKEETITIFDPQAARRMQMALAYKVIKQSGNDLKGRIHLMKIIYMLDCMLGLGLGINYLRYNRGPYNPIIESIEKNLSDKGIISVNTAKNYSYTVIDDSFDSKYNELFAKHNSEIEKIIDYMKRMKSSRAEKIATLYAAWNDMVIDGVQNITDKMIIDDVMNNWTENKAKTDFSTWQHILNDMKDKKIIPHGYGKHTRPRSE